MFQQATLFGKVLDVIESPEGLVIRTSVTPTSDKDATGEPKITFVAVRPNEKALQHLEMPLQGAWIFAQGIASASAKDVGGVAVARVELDAWLVLTLGACREKTDEREGSFQMLNDIVVGNLGKDDPEMRFTPAGIPVTNFSMCANTWIAEGKPEAANWFRIATWRKLAESVNQYLKHGQKVLVSGPLTASAYFHKDGGARASLELTAIIAKFLNSAGGAPAAGSQNQAPTDANGQPLQPW